MSDRHYKARIGKALIKLSDILIVFFCFQYIRLGLQSDHWIGFGKIFEMQSSIWEFFAILLMSALVNPLFSFMRLYDFRHWESRLNRIIRLVTGMSLCVAIVFSGAYILKFKGIDGKFLQVYLTVMVLVFVCYRGLVLLGVKIVRIKNRNLRNILIVGHNPRAMAIFKKLNKPVLGYNLIGFCDAPSIEKKMGSKLVCTTDTISEFISRHPIDEVIITLPIKSYYETINQIIDHCALHGVRCRMTDNLFKSHGMSPTIRIDRDRFINFDPNSRTEFQQDIKRLIDISVSVCCLIFSTPLFLII